MKSKIKIIRILNLFIMIIFLFPLITFAGDGSNIYWVSTNGAAAWDDAESATPLSGAACTDLITANRNAIAGDTVYFRAGSYKNLDEMINPTNSGTAWNNQIIFTTYNNEIVIFSPSRVAGDMEVDTGWGDYGTPTTHERSSEQAYRGTYSRKFTVDAADEGIKSSVFPTEATIFGKSAWVYSADRTSINVLVYNGSSVVDDYDETIIPGQWNFLDQDITFNGSASGTTAYVAYRSPTGVSSGTWYVDEVDVADNTPAVVLTGDDYIKVHGIIFEGMIRGLAILNGSDYNEISSCIFRKTLKGYMYRANIIASNESSGGTASTNNWIHDCTFHTHGYVQRTNQCFHSGGLFIIGARNAYGGSERNLVEDNVFYSCGHDLFTVNTSNNTIRNNVFHNEGWLTDHWGNCVGEGQVNDPADGFGNRGLTTEEPGLNDSDDTEHNLFEGNRYGHAGTPCQHDGAEGMSVTTDKNLLRFNYHFANGSTGFYLKGFDTYGYGPEDNRIYNNTIFRNGYGEDINYIPRRAGIYWGVTVYISGNVIKNNLFYDNYQDISYPDGDDTVENNWVTTDGDPLFVNPDISDPTSLTLPDLSLQSGSPAIDAGTYLTTVANSDTGTGTSLSVVDALYFQDGSWGPIGKIDADWIAVGTVGNYVQISSINYSTNAITLTSSISRNDGDSVWLVKDSSGNVVLRGLAPDMGAYEYPGHITPQKNLRIVP